MKINEIIPYTLAHLMRPEDIFIGKFSTTMGTYSRVNIHGVGEVYVRNLFKERV